MNPNELLRIVDSLHRDKNIDPEIVFQAIEAALVMAAKRQYGEERDIVVRITRENGRINASCDGEALDPEEMIGRIGAQTAKQVIIQKIREAERDSLIDEYVGQVGQMVSGVIQRCDGGAATVSMGSLEAILPRSEQIPGETHHSNERIRATIFEVRPQGSRVKVVLTRTRPQLVQRLFEQEIPEITEEVITVNALAREPGYRSKVAVSSSDQRVDCVGACVGVRGNRIKNIVDELAGERIDIVRWSDDPEVLIPNALQPAEVNQVLLCDMIGRAIVLVREDQLSLAIGRRGQNVRLASKLCGWDIEIMTADELEEQIGRAVTGFNSLEGVNEELAQALVEQGYLSYDDLSVIEPDALMEMGGLTAARVDQIVEQAEQRAEAAEEAAAATRHRQQEQKAKQEKQAQPESASEPEATATEASSAIAGDGEPAPTAGGEEQTPTSASREAESAAGDQHGVAPEPSEAEKPETESSAMETSAIESSSEEKPTDQSSGSTGEPLEREGEADQTEKTGQSQAKEDQTL